MCARLIIYNDIAQEEVDARLALDKIVEAGRLKVVAMAAEAGGIHLEHGIAGIDKLSADEVIFLVKNKDVASALEEVEAAGGDDAPKGTVSRHGLSTSEANNLRSIVKDKETEKEELKRVVAEAQKRHAKLKREYDLFQKRAIAEQLKLKTEASVELSRLRADAAAAKAAAASANPMAARSKSRRGSASFTAAQSQGEASAPEFPKAAAEPMPPPVAAEAPRVAIENVVGVPFTYARKEEKAQEEAVAEQAVDEVMNPRKVEEQIAMKRAEMEALARQLAKIKAANARAEPHLMPEEIERQAAKAREAKEKRLDAFSSSNTPSQSVAAALGIEAPRPKALQSPAKGGNGGGRLGGGGGKKPSWL